MQTYQSHFDWIARGSGRLHTGGRSEGATCGTFDAEPTKQLSIQPPLIHPSLYSPPPSLPDMKCRSVTNVSDYSAGTGGFSFSFQAGQKWLQILNQPFNDGSQFLLLLPSFFSYKNTCLRLQIFGSSAERPTYDVKWL